MKSVSNLQKLYFEKHENFTTFVISIEENLKFHTRVEWHSESNEHLSLSPTLDFDFGLFIVNILNLSIP